MRRIVLILLLLLPVLPVEAIDISNTPLFLKQKNPLFIFVPDQSFVGVRYHLWDERWPFPFLKASAAVAPTFYSGDGAPGTFSLLMRLSGYRVPPTDPLASKPQNSIYYNPDITYSKWEGTDPPEPDADFCDGFESYGINKFYTQLSSVYADPANRVLQYFTVPFDRRFMYPLQTRNWRKDVEGEGDTFEADVVRWPAAYYHYLGNNTIEYRNVLVQHNQVCNTPLPMGWNYNPSTKQWTRDERPGETFSFPYAYRYNTVTKAVTTFQNVPAEGYSYHPEGNLGVTFYRTPKEEMQNFANWWRFWSNKFRIIVGSLGSVLGKLDPSIEVALLPSMALERYQNDGDFCLGNEILCYPPLDNARIQSDPMTVMPTPLNTAAVANLRKTLYQELYPIRTFSIGRAWSRLGKFVQNDPTGAIWSEPCREVHGVLLRAGAFWKKLRAHFLMRVTCIRLREVSLEQ